MKSELGKYVVKARYFASSDSNCIVGFKQDAVLFVNKIREVSKNSILALVIAFCKFVG